MKLIILPEQSKPWFPSLHVQSPVVRSHSPFPLQGGLPPGHDLSIKMKYDSDVLYSFFKYTTKYKCTIHYT